MIQLNRVYYTKKPNIYFIPLQYNPSNNSIINGLNFRGLLTHQEYNYWHIVVFNTYFKQISENIPEQVTAKLNDPFLLLDFHKNFRSII